MTETQLKLRKKHTEKRTRALTFNHTGLIDSNAESGLSIALIQSSYGFNVSFLLVTDETTYF